MSVKLIFDKKNVHVVVGAGRLPERLRNMAKDLPIVTSDTYDNNLCLWRCRAVHKGARPDRSTQKTKALAKEFYYREYKETAGLRFPKFSVDELDEVENYFNKSELPEEWLGMAVYEPILTENIRWKLMRNTLEFIKDKMVIGAYGGHASSIKGKIGRSFICNDWGADFTKLCHLACRDRTCKKGERQT